MAGLYFPHDYTAAKDSKIIALRKAFGWEGYGVFWALIEMLASDSSHILPTDYNSLAWELRFDAGKLKKLVCDFGLFTLTEDGSGFYSERMSQQLQDIDDLRQKRSKAGKASAAKRQRLIEQKITNNEQKEADSNDNSNTCSTHVEVLFNKENKIKENINLNNTFDKSKDIVSSEQKICSTTAASQNEEKDLFGNKVPKETKPEVRLTEFKIILNDGSYYTVIADELENWQKLYPAVDVPQELRNMQGWSDANPRKRKTKTGIKRFINKWLADEQNKGGSGRFQVPPKRFEPLPTSKRPIGKPSADDCPF